MRKRRNYNGPHLHAALKCLREGYTANAASWMNRDIGEVQPELKYAHPDSLRIETNGTISYRECGQVEFWKRQGDYVIIGLLGVGMVVGCLGFPLLLVFWPIGWVIKRLFPKFWSPFGDKG